MTLQTTADGSEDAQGNTTTRSRTISSISYLASANLIAKAFSFIFVLFATRLLGTALFGNYTSVLAFVGLFGAFTELGLSTLAVRDIVQDRSLAVRYISNLVVLRLALSSVAIVLIVFLTRIYMAPSLHSAVYVYALALLPLSIANTLQIMFQVNERMEYGAILNVATSAVTAGASIVALLAGYHVLALVTIFTIVNAINAMSMAWLVYGRFLPFQWQFDPGWWPTLLRNAIPFMMLTLLNVLYYNADMQLLYVLSGCGRAHGNVGCTPVGQYGVATRLLNILVMIFVASASTVLLPMLNRVVTESRDALKRVIRSAAILTLAFGVAVALLGTFYARDALRILGGHSQGYLDAAPALAVLMWAFPCFLLLGVFYNALYALHRQMVVTVAFAVTLVFNIAFNVLLIPRYSYMASSGLTVSSEVLNGVIVVVALRHTLGPLRLTPVLLKVGAVSLAAAAVLLALRGYSIIVGLPTGVLILMVGFRLARLFGPPEREILGRIPVIGRYAWLL